MNPYCVFGIGSPHGDDQVGWLVVEELRRRGLATAHAIKEATQLLDYTDDCSAAAIVDSCVTGAEPGTIHQFTWPDERIAEESRTASTHAIDLARALRLAETLGRLPKNVIVHAVEISCWEPGPEVSSAVRGALSELVERLLQEASSVT